MIIQKNSITVVGTLQKCWLLVYRTPVEEARKWLPRSLEPVTYNSWAFWNIVVCRIKQMRPKYFPAWIGVDYWHVAYRLYASLSLPDGQKCEGLYFVRSDCDNPLMSLAGNIMTDFRFHTARIGIEEQPEQIAMTIGVPEAGAYVELEPIIEQNLQPGSAFTNLEEAAAFLKYKPYGISFDKQGNTNVVHITRDEQAWKSRLIHVKAAQWEFLRDKEVALEICYDIEPILYQWDRGKIYRVSN